MNTSFCYHSIRQMPFFFAFFPLNFSIFWWVKFSLLCNPPCSHPLIQPKCSHNVVYCFVRSISFINHWCLLVLYSGMANSLPATSSIRIQRWKCRRVEKVAAGQTENSNAIKFGGLLFRINSTWLYRRQFPLQFYYSVQFSLEFTVHFFPWAALRNFFLFLLINLRAAILFADKIFAFLTFNQFFFSEFMCLDVSGVAFVRVEREPYFCDHECEFKPETIMLEYYSNWSIFSSNG